MMWTRCLVVLCGLLMLSACRKPKDPPVPLPNGARLRLNVQKKFALAGLDFNSNDIGKAIPAMLLTELADGGRFSVREGGGIRRDKDTGPAITEATAFKEADGYVNGTITSITSSEVCFDVRLANAYNHEVLFAKSTCTPLQMAENTMKPEREAIKRLAEDISRTIKEVGNANVISVDGRQIFIDKGKASGLMSGMVGYVVATGMSGTDAPIIDSVKNYSGIDPSQIISASLPIVVAEVYVLEVAEKLTVAYLIKGNYALPGDTVFFK